MKDHDDFDDQTNNNHIITTPSPPVRSAEQKKPRGVDQEMQHVLSLIAARSRGEVTNVVEEAVAQLLESTGQQRAATTTTTADRATAKPITTNPQNEQQDQKKQPQEQQQQEHQQPPQQLPQPVVDSTEIVVDDDDYDNDDSNDKKEKLSTPRKRPRKSLKSTPASKRRLSSVPSKDNGSKNDNNDNNDDDEEEEDLLDQVPLGRQGAKMMTTFGDGSDPRHDTVAAALLGARHMLQVAIRDARAIRRRAKQHYELAKIMTMNKKKNSIATHAATSAIDSTMLFRAMEGYDKLAYDPKCGFDMEQLLVLFPEEMNAYTRWNEMHSAYVANTAKDDEQPTDASAPTENVPEEEEEEEGGAVQQEFHPEEDQVGHLQERVAHFDARTRIMNDDWYLRFALMRRGSFLPTKLSNDEVMNDSSTTTAAAAAADGNNNSNTKSTQHWENKPATSVRFLHWVGFDPRSSLPPPDEQTTHALAFLCYDFFGRIVEKAVFIRNSRRHTSADMDIISRELDDGDQLEPTDIELALQDPEIRPVPLYGGTEPSDAGNNSSKAAMATQLYFGPGFEERLELEMEELLSGSTKGKEMSEEECKIRLEEDTLFSKLQSPPAVDRIGGHLMEDL